MGQSHNVSRHAGNNFNLCCCNLYYPCEESAGYLTESVRLSVCLSVYLSAGLLKSLDKNFDELFVGVGQAQGGTE